VYGVFCVVMKWLFCGSIMFCNILWMSSNWSAEYWGPDKFVVQNFILFSIRSYILSKDFLILTRFCLTEAV